MKMVEKRNELICERCGSVEMIDEFIFVLFAGLVMMFFFILAFYGV